MDQVTRSAHLNMKARMRALEERVAKAEQGEDAAREDARKLAEFVQQRMGTNVWSHKDVMALVRVLHCQVRDTLARGAERARTSPASHLLYKRMMDQAFKDAAAVAEDFKPHAEHPNVLRDEMLEQLADTVRPPDRS